jgi:MoaA/NifB/PqqE/SkfB family radical SAM enzyme
MELIAKSVPSAAPITPDSLLLLRLGERCNHECPMCTNTRLPDRWWVDTPELVRRVRHVAALGFRRVMLTGGEPTLHPGFFDVVEALQGAGLTWDLNTHGRAFHREDLAQRAREGGLERAIVSLHSHLPEVSGRMSGAPPAAFEQTVEGVRNLLRAGAEVTLNLVLSTLNLDDLEGYLAFVGSELPGVAGVKLSFPSLYSQGHEWAPVRLALSAAHQPLSRVPEWSRGYGVAVCYESIPNCITGDPELTNLGRRGWGETHYLEDRDGVDVLSIAWLEAQTAVYVPACVRCAAFARCPGVGRRYAELHGTAELVPFPDPGRPWWGR